MFLEEWKPEEEFKVSNEVLVFKDEWRSEKPFSECNVSFEDEDSFKKVESEDIGVLYKVSKEWSWNSRKLESGKSSEASEDEEILMNSGGITFLEMGEISIEENEWSEKVSRKHEGTSR